MHPAPHAVVFRSRGRRGMPPSRDAHFLFAPEDLRAPRVAGMLIPPAPAPFRPWPCDRAPSASSLGEDALGPLRFWTVRDITVSPAARSNAAHVPTDGHASQRPKLRDSLQLRSRGREMCCRRARERVCGRACMHGAPQRVLARFRDPAAPRALWARSRAVARARIRSAIAGGRVRTRARGLSVCPGGGASHPCPFWGRSDGRPDMCPQACAHAPLACGLWRRARKGSS